MAGADARSLRSTFRRASGSAVSSSVKRSSGSPPTVTSASRSHVWSRSRPRPVLTRSRVSSWKTTSSPSAVVRTSSSR